MLHGFLTQFWPTLDQVLWTKVHIRLSWLTQSTNKATCWAIEMWTFCHYIWEPGWIFLCSLYGHMEWWSTYSGFVLDEKNTIKIYCFTCTHECITRSTSEAVSDPFIHLSFFCAHLLCWLPIKTIIGYKWLSLWLDYTYHIFECKLCESFFISVWQSIHACLSQFTCHSWLDCVIKLLQLIVFKMLHKYTNLT